MVTICGTLLHLKRYFQPQHHGLLVVLYKHYVLYPQPLQRRRTVAHATRCLGLNHPHEIERAGVDVAALWLRDAAQSNLEQSLSTQWIDLQLAEAALVRHFAVAFTQ